MLPKPQDLRGIVAEFKQGRPLRDILANKKFKGLSILVRVSDLDREAHLVEDAFLQVEPLLSDPPGASYYLDGSAADIERGKLKDFHSPNSTFEFEPECVWDLVNHNLQLYLRGAHTYMRQRKP